MQRLFFPRVFFLQNEVKEQFFDAKRTKLVTKDERVNMCLRACVYERVCVCVSKRKRECVRACMRERERECVCERERERERERVSVCVRERERESVCVRERERERENSLKRLRSPSFTFQRDIKFNSVFSLPWTRDGGQSEK